MSLMSELLHIVSEDARTRKIAQVHEITVIVGDLSNVLADALELAFYYFQKQGLALINENTKLQIIREVAKAKCQSCSFEFEPDYQIAFCPKCNVANCLLVAGETFQVESYEGSVEFESET